MSEHTTELTIRFSNLTPPQAMALMLMVREMEHLSAVGSSRFVAFYADGDGNFRPNIDVGVADEDVDYFFDCWDEVKDIERFRQWSDDICFIDFDPIAWYLRSKEEAENETDENG